MRAAPEQLPQVEKFSFLRVARPLPKLRTFTPFLRRVKTSPDFAVQLPTQKAVQDDFRVAIFDGGLPSGDKILSRWAKAKKTTGIGERVPGFVEHGSAVTSAFLFGPLQKDYVLPVPYAEVDHYRVLDNETGKSEDLFDVLPRITDILSRDEHKFINLSIGPDLPVEDDEVTAWTSTLDLQFADGSKFATIAVGNNGESDIASGNARVQVPSDCVNAVAVGACDTVKRDRWCRAPYSAHGPGRSPGTVKPDVVSFGGTESNPFYVISPDNPTRAMPVQGTSFAAPSVLRLAAGVSAEFGDKISPLAIRAALIHRAEDSGLPRSEVGWGRVPEIIDEVVTCRDGVVSILYQGELEPGKYVRAEIPTPFAQIPGNARITATFCFATVTDPQDPCSYTRSGLEIQFRPNKDKLQESGNTLRPKTSSFFQNHRKYLSEAALRHDLHKWEPVLHDSRTMRGSSLVEPRFDIHYGARESGAATTNGIKIPYALIVSIEAPKMPDIYSQVHTKYRSVLEVLQPIQVPVRV